MPVLTGRRIEHIDQRREGLRIPFPDNLAGRLTGRIIRSFDRRAKYILIHLDNEQIAVLHLGMSGRVLILEAGHDYTPQKHDHLILTFDDGARLVYNDPRRFGMFFMLGEDELVSHKAFAALGPEPLGNGFNAPYLLTVLKTRKSSIKEAIMDQKTVVGVGNIYACESLYESSIHPARRACDLSGDEAELLTRAIKSVLERAIRAGGSSLKDYRHPDDKLGYFQHQFAVYGRAGDACNRCGDSANIKKITQGGRSTFFCESCQK